MIKLTGNIFKHPMEYNQVTLSGNFVRIHNTDNAGFGFMQQYKNPVEVTEKISFILDKKNYTLLGSLGEFKLEKKDKTIIIAAKDFKAKFADLIDVHLIEPDTSDMRPLSIDYKDIYAGRNFAGAPDNTRIQLDGATVLKEGIIMSNGYRIFLKSMPDESRPEINIPIDVFRRLDSGTDYQVKTNGKLIVFLNGGQAFYSSLIEVLMKFVQITPAKAEFKINKTEMLSSLKLIKNYTNIVHLEAEKAVLKLSATVEANEINLSLPIEPINLKRVVINGNLNDFIMILNTVESDEATIYISDRMIYTKNGDVTAISGIVTCQGMEVLGNE